MKRPKNLLHSTLKTSIGDNSNHHHRHSISSSDVEKAKSQNHEIPMANNNPISQEPQGLSPAQKVQEMTSMNYISVPTDIAPNSSPPYLTDRLKEIELAVKNRYS